MSKVIGIGNLAVDFYYIDNELIGIDGGKTTSNIIANLACLGHKTLMYGDSGNDIYGNIAISSLNNLGVDISKVNIRDDMDTKQFHISFKNNKSNARRECLYCGTKRGPREGSIDINKALLLINNGDIIVIDSFCSVNMKIVESVKDKCQVMMDMGYSISLRWLDPNEIIELLKDKFTIINMNERVEKFLTKRLGVTNLELFNLLGSKLLIITRGKKGADFITGDGLISKGLDNVSEEIDPNGAGDAFFATIISEYINNEYIIDKKMLGRAFIKATNITKEIVSKVGARSHISELREVKKASDFCSCQRIELK